ncbi:MAG: dTMP kinase [Pseudomonadota bacterium]
MPAAFITFEGGEGSGKTTQLQRIGEALRDKGLTVLQTREPGGAPGAEAIRALLLEGAADRWSPVSEALLLAAARHEHVQQTIKPALAGGTVVLCDRFIDSTRAYQGGGHGQDRAMLEHLIALGTGGLQPDLTLIFDLPVETALKRVAQRAGEKSRFDALDPAFHERVRAAFKAIAEAQPERCKLVDADRDTPAVTADLLALLAKRYSWAA